MRRLLFLFLFTLWFCRISVAQTFDKYKLYMSEADIKKIDADRISDFFVENVKTRDDLDQFMHNFYEKGFLLAAYQLDKFDSAIYRVTITLGEQFVWAELDQGNLPDDLFFKTGFKKNIFQTQIFNFRKITHLFRSVIRFSENHGYPFARIKLTNIEIINNRIAASLDYEAGPYILFSGLAVNDGINLKSSFLEAYLTTRPGTPFDQRKINRISHRINQLAFIRMTGEPLIKFANDSCRIYLKLEPVKANSFDGIIGFLPNENEPNKLLVTGQLFLGLNNLFRSGKKLDLEWQKPNLLTQELQIKYVHPALFRIPLDLSMDFYLFKQDTSFINRNIHLSFYLNRLKFGNLGFDYAYSSSRLLSTDNLQTIPELDLIDFDLNYYGFNYRLNTLDRIFFPTSGVLIEASLQMGTKNIIRNAGIDSDKYQDLQESTFQLKSTLLLEKYTTLAPKNILFTKVTAGYLNNDQMFFNDLFRLGGLRSLRGFNDKFFYASWYLIGTVEYRYLFENDSQLFLFVDGAGLGYEINDQSYRDHPFGFGGGFSISTRAGLLNIIYALGKSKNQPFGLNYSKIHIGYSSRF